MNEINQIKLISSFKPRVYQETIFGNSLNKNSLVVIPTGLGKTIIALLLSTFYFNNSKKKILFLAPTKPLVEQQKTAFMNFFKNPNDFKFQVLTGLVGPKKRIKLYEENNFIFSTPQLIENDIINNLINIKDFSLIIFDEAHRATGNYAYKFIAEEFNKKNVNILALTASPGTSIEQITEVIENLKIEYVEVKKYDDFDVKPYVKKTKVEYLEVELNNKFKEIKNKLNECYFGRLKLLKNLGFLQEKNINTITKTDLLKLQIELRIELNNSKNEIIFKAISISAGLMKLSYGIELFESQEIVAAYNYFYDFFRSNKQKTKAVEELLVDIRFREAFEEISKLKKQNIKHPKLIKLKEIIGNELKNNPDLKLIIFSQYRESAIKITSELEEIKELKPALFVGQSKKNNIGLSQKNQKKILDDFRENKYNILVSTSVGEEGLDIPKVDLVIFYEPIPSAIRTIQRSGRTGRFNEGKVIVLITKDTRDVIMRHVAKAKEKKMYNVLDKIKENYQNKDTINLKPKGVEKEIGLDKFIKKNNDNDNNNSNNNNKNVEKKVEINSNFDDRILIYIDSRENNALIKELFKIEEIKIETKRLDVGDIIISENIAIERKSKKDFVNSIIDKRLFLQLKDLTLNYRRPVLVLEGEEDIFSIRNLNPNVIRATLSSIAIDYRIPIIYTKDLEDTAQFIRTIAKRTTKVKKEISLVSNKTSFSENEELEKVISSIPKINVVTAKNILNYFNTIEKLIKAKEKDIENIEGIGKIRARYIYNFFRREFKKE